MVKINKKKKCSVYVLVDNCFRYINYFRNFLCSVDFKSEIFVKKILFLTLLIHTVRVNQFKDYLRLAVELGFFLLHNFFIARKNFQIPPLSIVLTSIRNIIRWETLSPKRANKLSDILLYGVFVEVCLFLRTG